MTDEDRDRILRPLYWASSGERIDLQTDEASAIIDYVYSVEAERDRLLLESRMPSLERTETTSLRAHARRWKALAKRYRRGIRLVHTIYAGLRRRDSLLDGLQRKLPSRSEYARQQAAAIQALVPLGPASLRPLSPEEYEAAPEPDGPAIRRAMDSAREKLRRLGNGELPAEPEAPGPDDGGAA